MLVIFFDSFLANIPILYQRLSCFSREYEMGALFEMGYEQELVAGL